MSSPSKTQGKYQLTPEHEAQLKPWADKWIENALSTKPMDDADRAAMVTAIDGLYDAADLDRPRHIVFVPSPLAARIAAGFAAAIWHVRGNNTAVPSNGVDLARVAAVVLRSGDVSNTISKTAASAANTDTFKSTARDTYTVAINAIEQVTELATALAAREVVRDAAGFAVDEAIHQQVDGTGNATDNEAISAIAYETISAARVITHNAAEDRTRGHVLKGTLAAVHQATEAATVDATVSAIDRATLDATERDTQGAMEGGSYDVASKWNAWAAFEATQETSSSVEDALDIDTNAAASTAAPMTANPVVNVVSKYTFDATEKNTRAVTDEATYRTAAKALHTATEDATDESTRSAIANTIHDMIDDTVDEFAAKATDFGAAATVAMSTARGPVRTVIEDAVQLRTRKATHLATQNATYREAVAATARKVREDTLGATFAAANIGATEAVAAANKGMDELGVRDIITPMSLAVDAAEATDARPREATRRATYNAAFDATREVVDPDAHMNIDMSLNVATSEATMHATAIPTDDAAGDDTDEAIDRFIDEVTDEIANELINDLPDDATDDGLDELADRIADTIFLDAPPVNPVSGSTNDAAGHALSTRADTDTFAATTPNTYNAVAEGSYRATSIAADDTVYTPVADATYEEVAKSLHVERRTIVAATNEAVNGSVRHATGRNTYGVASEETFEAILPQTHNDTIGATAEVLEEVTRAASDATIAAMMNEVADATDQTKPLTAGWAVRLAKAMMPGKEQLLLRCAQGAWRMANAGNHISGWPSLLSFFRHVAKLDLPIYEKWKHYEDAAVHGSWRYMHHKFCIVSDRPETLKIDDQGRPHCENGPSHRWRDGWELFHWHGVRVPALWIEKKDTLTAEIALSQDNAELRRVACEIVGWDKVLEDPALNPVILDEDMPHIGTLIQVDLPEAPEQWFIKFQCGTGRTFAEPVNNKTFNTALKANAAGNGWRPGMGDPDDFIPFIRT